MKKQLAFDIEVYKNYALFSFQCLETSRYVELELYDGCPLDVKKLANILSHYQIISFNGRNFDIPITLAAIQGAGNQRLKDICDAIISEGLPSYKTYHRFAIAQNLTIDHIDIMEPSPGVGVSLKLYGGRIGYPKLQDLPIEPDAWILPRQREQLRLYCRNDLGTTAALYRAVENEINLRSEMSKQYRVDLRSLSGAQVAKAVFKKLLTDSGVSVSTPNVKAGTKFQYQMPDWINFKTEELRAVKTLVEKAVFVVNDSGSVVLPDELKKVINFDGAKYKVGIGGLHSQEKKQAVIAADNQLLFEKDVASMYPSMILGQRLYPAHLSHKFVKIYADMVKRRLEAKASGDKATADSLKLVINSSFGLFGNKYGFLYSPDLLIQTTITGQLCLLMLIEAVTAIGAKVVSANTDGINILCDKADYERVNDACFDWEITTGLTLEENRYKATYSESVNSYIAVCDNGKVKSKGNYALPGLMKNTVNSVCIEAVIAYLADNRPIVDTINHCDDIKKFLTVRTVNGGAVYGCEYLGRVVRWYYGHGDQVISYKKNGNKVPRSDGAIPCMNLPDEIPSDLNRQWYIDEARSMLTKLGL